MWVYDMAMITVGSWLGLLCFVPSNLLPMFSTACCISLSIVVPPPPPPTCMALKCLVSYVTCTLKRTIHVS